MTVATRLPMATITIDVRGILKAIENLKLSSSARDNQNNSKIEKNTKDLSAFFAHPISNHSLEARELPSDWKAGRVIFIFKTGNKIHAQIYRPISLQVYRLDSLNV